MINILITYYFRFYSSGVIKISPYARLDRDVVDSYAIVVNAIDAGIPAETSTATVKVIILDVNDKPPKYEIKSPI